MRRRAASKGRARRMCDERARRREILRGGVEGVDRWHRDKARAADGATTNS